jgi:hypothetical protein
MRKSNLIWLVVVAIALMMVFASPLLLAQTSPISPLPTPDDGIEWTYCVLYVYPAGGGTELVCSDTMPDLSSAAEWRSTVCVETSGMERCTKT